MLALVTERQIMEVERSFCIWYNLTGRPYIFIPQLSLIMIKTREKVVRLAIVDRLQLEGVSILNRSCTSWYIYSPFTDLAKAIYPRGSFYKDLQVLGTMMYPCSCYKELTDPANQILRLSPLKIYHCDITGIYIVPKRRTFTNLYWLILFIRGLNRDVIRCIGGKLFYIKCCASFMRVVS